MLMVHSKYDSLECGFCYEKFRDPVKLGCGHSVCFSCADTLFSLNKLAIKPSLNINTAKDSSNQPEKPVINSSRSSNGSNHNNVNGNTSLSVSSSKIAGSPVSVNSFGSVNTSTATSTHPTHTAGHSSPSKSVTSSSRESVTSTSISLEMPQVRLPCPICSLVTYVDMDQGVKSLTIDLDLVDMLKSHEETDRPQCGNDCGKTANCACLHCDVSLCESCFSTIHKAKALSHHQMSALSERDEKSQPCPKHKDCMLEHYCTECRKPVCEMCSQFGSDHKGHTFTSLNDYAFECKKQVSTGTKLVKNMAVEFLEAKNRTESMVKDVMRVQEECNDKICDVFSQIIGVVEQRKQKLLDISNQIKDRKVLKLKEQALVFEALYKNVNEIYQRVAKLSSSNLPSSIVLAKHKISALIKIIEALDVQLKPCFDSRVMTKLENSTLLDTLNAFGTIFVTDVPAQPSPPQVVSRTCNSIKVRWLVVDGNGSNICAYKLQIALANSTQFKDLYTGRSLEFEVHNLRPHTSYQFRVQAANEIGFGPFSGSVVVSTQKGKEFNYTQDFDTNGLFYYLGTNKGKEEWENPAVTGKVVVTQSTNGASSGDHKAIAGRAQERCYTSNAPGQFVQFELQDCSIIPSYYTIRHWNEANYALRTWNLEGSNDGQKWTVLREHVNDASISADAGSTASWPITSSTGKPFRFFRVLQKGKNSSDTDHLMMSGFEIYGVFVQSA